MSLMACLCMNGKSLIGRSSSSVNRSHCHRQAAVRRGPDPPSQDLSADLSAEALAEAEASAKAEATGTVKNLSICSFVDLFVFLRSSEHFKWVHEPRSEIDPKGISDRGEHLST